MTIIGPSRRIKRFGLKRLISLDTVSGVAVAWSPPPARLHGRLSETGADLLYNPASRDYRRHVPRGDSISIMEVDGARVGEQIRRSATIRSDAEFFGSSPQTVSRSGGSRTRERNSTFGTATSAAAINQIGKSEASPASPKRTRRSRSKA